MYKINMHMLKPNVILQLCILYFPTICNSHVTVIIKIRKILSHKVENAINMIVDEF